MLRSRQQRCVRSVRALCHRLESNAVAIILNMLKDAVANFCGIFELHGRVVDNTTCAVWIRFVYFVFGSGVCNIF